MLIVRSPLRISFAGGGTDLPTYYERFGGAVLSTTIDKYFYTILAERSDRRIQVISSDWRVLETWRDIAALDIRGSDLELPLAVLKDLGRDLSVDLFLASEIPPGTGLGCSASACESILKAITTYLDQPISKYKLAERAFYILRNTLGRPIGKQDEFAAAFGGLNLITFHPDDHSEVKPIDLSPGVLHELQSRLMLFFTGSAQHSWMILQEQEHSIRNYNGPTIEALHEVRALVDRMVATLKSGDLDSFGALLDESWQKKKRIAACISNAKIDHLYKTARSTGALGGKITGAGSGGFLLLYCAPDRQEEVRAALKAEGIGEMAFTFDSKGTHVVVNEPLIDVRSGRMRSVLQLLSNVS